MGLGKGLGLGIGLGLGLRAHRIEPWLSTDAYCPLRMLSLRMLNCPLMTLSSAGGGSFGAWFLIQASLWPRPPLLVLALVLLVLALLALALLALELVLLGKPAKGSALGSPPAAADGCCVREGAPCGRPCSSKAGLSPGLCMSSSSCSGLRR